MDLWVSGYSILVVPWLDYFLLMGFYGWYIIQSGLESEKQLKTNV